MTKYYLPMMKEGGDKEADAIVKKQNYCYNPLLIFI